jgi:hypothetical protein
VALDALGRARFVRALFPSVRLHLEFPAQRLAWTAVYASKAAADLQQAACVQCPEKPLPWEAAFVRCQEKPLPRELSPEWIEAVALACPFQGPCQVREALVKLCPEALYPVCPEGSVFQAVWHVVLAHVALLQGSSLHEEMEPQVKPHRACRATPQALRVHRGRRVPGCPGRVLLHESVAEHFSDFQSESSVLPVLRFERPPSRGWSLAAQPWFLWPEAWP